MDDEFYSSEPAKGNIENSPKKNVVKVTNNQVRVAYFYNPHGNGGQFQFNYSERQDKNNVLYIEAAPIAEEEKLKKTNRKKCDWTKKINFQLGVDDIAGILYQWEQSPVSLECKRIHSSSSYGDGQAKLSSVTVFSTQKGKGDSMLIKLTKTIRGKNKDNVNSVSIFISGEQKFKFMEMIKCSFGKLLFG